MRSNRGESLFMTGQYARVAEISSSLDNCVCAILSLVDRQVSFPVCDVMARRDLIADKLTQAFAPESLKVLDESHQHAGHAAYRVSGATHFRGYIVAGGFLANI